MTATITTPPRQLLASTVAWLDDNGDCRFLADGKGKFRDVTIVHVERYRFQCPVPGAQPTT